MAAMPTATRRGDPIWRATALAAPADAGQDRRRPPDDAPPAPPEARLLLDLQRTAGNRAVSRLLQQVQRDERDDAQRRLVAAGGGSAGGRRPIASGGGSASGRRPIASGGGSSGGRRPIAAGGGEGSAAYWHGTEVDLVGVVDQDGTNPGKDSDGRPGVNLRPTPGTSNNPLGRLADRDHVVAKEYVGDGWMRVVPTDGHTWGGESRGGELKGIAGYVKAPTLVNFQLPPDPASPDPGAFLYRIHRRERAHQLVRDVYGAGNVETGQDQRFFTNVLKYINDKEDRGAAFKVKEKVRRAGPVAWIVEDIELEAGKQIWIPSLAMAQSLKGTVSRGSFVRNIAEKVKGWAKTAAAVPAFLAGLVLGAIESIRDLFVGLFDLVWDAIKSLGKSLVDAAEAIYEVITDSRRRGAVFDAIAKELEDLVGDKVSFLRRWYNWGRIIGYATMEVISMVLLAGAAQAVKAGKWGARIAKFTGAIGEVPAIKNITKGAKAVRESAAGRRIAELTAPVGAAAKKTGQVIDAVTGAPGRAILGTTRGVATGWRKVRAALGKRIGATAKAAAAGDKASPVISIYHGTGQRGFEGVVGRGRSRINVAHTGGGHHDLGRGFYMSSDLAVAEAYAKARGKGGLQHVMQWDIPIEKLGVVVDIRPGGNYGKDWDAFLDRPYAGGLVPDQPTYREAIAKQFDRRGEYFEEFLASIDLKDPDTIVAPLGRPPFIGIGEGTQLVIRSQKVADVLNALMGAAR